MPMVRLQILLTPDENSALRLEALKRRVSISAVVRAHLSPLLSDAECYESYLEDPLLQTIGMGSSDENEPPDGSVEHDRYLYGGERRD